MKKRIVCFLLTLIMLVSLAPVSAVTASAASLKTSEAAITVLKKLTRYESVCYQVEGTQEFRIGYGTICTGKGHKVDPSTGAPTAESETHTLKGEYEADAALREALKDFDKKVNAFASSNGLTLAQNQHDALVIFSYGFGTAWMDGSGVLKTAVINKAGTNELLSALMTYGSYADVDRHRVEANMYVNNVYSNVAPSSFVAVTYDANGGSLPQGDSYSMFFDTTKTGSHPVTPTRNGYIFLGWYIEDEAWAPSLNADCADKTLVAHWQVNGMTYTDAMDEYGAGNADYTLSKSSLASSKLYTKPDVKKGEVRTTKVETTFTVSFDYIGTDGTRWAYGETKEGKTGWVIVRAGSNGIPAAGSDIDVTVTVTNSYVNSRVNATIHCATNGSYQKGAKLRIINTETKDGFLWGQVARSAEDDTPIGWVALMYTDWNSVKDQQSNSGSTNTSNAIARATVINTSYVNVRSDAGTDNKIVGSLAQGETVDILEIKTVNGHRWGRTTSGWFCLTYANLTMLVSESKVSDAGALTYTFTGTTEGGKAHVAPGSNTNYVDYVDARNNHYDGIPTGETTSVTITNMVVADGATWAKATWKNAEKDKDKKDITVTRSGWIILTDVTSIMPFDTGDDTAEAALDPVKFTVVADEVSVREEPSNSADLVIKLNKGVEVEITGITLVGENIWGYTDNETDIHPYDGFVNLATKYFKRSTLPTIDTDEGDHDLGMKATVINTDSVRVRNYGSTTSGQVIGSLSRGTTVAVWETNEDKDWYKVDSNQNGTYDYEGDGWVSAQYLELTKVTSSSGTSDGSQSGEAASSTTGIGIVANTYAGVNVRSGAGIGFPAVGKLLPGTQVKIMETKTVGAAKWGHVKEGWICMDYVTMISYDQIPGNNNTNNNSGNGTAVDDLDKVEKTTTTAVYTGTVVNEVQVLKSPALDADVVRTVSPDEPITMYELVVVTDIVDKSNESENSGGTSTTIKKTSYWARVNEGYIFNPGENLKLEALDEKVHTLTGSDTLNIREQPTTDSTKLGQLKKGDQVTVTKLSIVNDKVWGWAETKEGLEGWIRLDYMSEGAYYVNETPAPTTPTSNTPVIGSSGNTGSGGFVTNSSGYKYTGKVIRNGSTPLKVRASASSTASVTTTLKNGASLVIYETTIADNMAWGRCDGGWVYLYYVDLTPCSGSAIDAKVVYTENTIAYTDSNCSEVAGTYSRMSVVDIYEVVGKMARTDLGWVNTDNLG